MEKAKFIRECKIIGVSLVVGLVFAGLVAAYTFVYSHATVQDISGNVIRLHVRANSNCEADQELKDLVRHNVLTEFEELIINSTCIDETRMTLTENLYNIRQFAEDVVRVAGYGYTVTASISRQFFPTTFYGGLTFPPGEYEALQIILGEGSGNNWWCLMFPPLCYVDMTSTEKTQAQLASSVSENSLRLLMHADEPTHSLVVRFRVVEWWQNRGQPNTTEPVRNFVRSDR